MSDSFSSHMYLLLHDIVLRVSQRWDTFTSSSLEGSSALYPTKLKGDQLSYIQGAMEGMDRCSSAQTIPG